MYGNDDVFSSQLLFAKLTIISKLISQDLCILKHVKHSIGNQTTKLKNFQNFMNGTSQANRKIVEIVKN